MIQWSSLFYNTSATNERHECDTNNTSATRLKHEWHECDTSATRTTRTRHEWKILILVSTRVKTYFPTPILAMWQVKDHKERNNFILGTTFFEMPCSRVKMQLKSAPQKLDFVMTKAISKSYTLDCSCKLPCRFPHSYV